MTDDALNKSSEAENKDMISKDNNRGVQNIISMKSPRILDHESFIAGDEQFFYGVPAI
jgi:hypothetical protein